MALQFGDLATYQDRAYERRKIVITSTSSRALPLQDQQWQTLKNRRTLKAEKRRDNRALLDMKHIWAVPITS